MSKRTLMILIALYAWCGKDGSAASTTCSKNGAFTSAVPGVTLDNRLNSTAGCVQWRLSYYSTGFTALSIAVQAAPDVSGVPGAWADISSTLVTQGANPSTGLSSEIALQFYMPWVRVNVSSVTGSGMITYNLNAINASVAVSRPAGSSGPGSTIPFSSVTGATSTEHYVIGASGQMQSAGTGFVEANRLRTYTIPTLPVATVSGRIAQVTDAVDDADCIVGGGAVDHICYANGISWGPVGGAKYQTIQDEGVSLTQRRTLNMTGAGVTCSDDVPNLRTNCNIPGGGGGGGNTITTGLLASLPAATAAGDMYVPTDSLFSFAVSNGVTWDFFKDGRKLTPAPTVVTSVNLAGIGSTNTAYGPGYRIDWTSAGTNFNVGGIVHAKLAATFTYTLGIMQTWSTSGSGGCGLLLSNGTTAASTVIYFGYFPYTGGGLGVTFPIANFQAFNAGALGAIFNGPSTTAYGPIYFRVQETASNRLYSISTDNGVNWYQIFSEANTAHITTSHVGAGIEIGNSTQTGHCTFFEWLEQ